MQVQWLGSDRSQTSHFDLFAFLFGVLSLLPLLGVSFPNPFPWEGSGYLRHNSDIITETGEDGTQSLREYNGHTDTINRGILQGPPPQALLPWVSFLLAIHLPLPGENGNGPRLIQAVVDQHFAAGTIQP